MTIIEKEGKFYAIPDVDWLTDWTGVFSKELCAPSIESLQRFADCTDEERIRWEEDNLPPAPEPEPESQESVEQSTE